MWNLMRQRLSNKILENCTIIGNLNFSDGFSVLRGAGVPVDYTDGDPVATGEGTAMKGTLYVDTTNGKVYVNGGTMAQPVWKIVTSAA